MFNISFMFQDTLILIAVFFTLIQYLIMTGLLLIDFHFLCFFVYLAILFALWQIDNVKLYIDNCLWKGNKFSWNVIRKDL